MSTELAQVPRVFVDTGHLVNLVNLSLNLPIKGVQTLERQQAYRRLHEMIRGGECTIASYEPAIYEWVWGNTMQRAHQIASVFDAAVSTKRILPDPLIFIVEAMQQCRRVEPRLPFPEVRIVDDVGAKDELQAGFALAWPHKGEQPETMPVRISSPGARPRMKDIVTAFYQQLQRRPQNRRIALEGEQKALADTARLSPHRARPRRPNGSRAKLRT